MAIDARCTAVTTRNTPCGNYGAQPKTTQRMVGRRPPRGWTAQPMYLCARHWPKYEEVGGVSGLPYPKRPFPQEGR